MESYFDKITLQYWFENRERIRPKSYSCSHNGYVYGDNMEFNRIAFVFIDDSNEIVIEEESPRKTYIKFVEAACNQSIENLRGFMDARAEKYRVFPEEIVSTFTKTQRESTRINGENSAIFISDEKYYVANNLKKCEYFNAAVDALTEEYRKKWYIRITCNDEYRNAPLKAVDELQSTDTKTYNEFKLIFEDEYVSKEGKRKKRTISNQQKTDYLALNKKKKTIGDLGEYIVLEYEKKKLLYAGFDKLVNRIEHTSLEVGDNKGYDIKSFTESGEPLYIEVKSTEQNNSGSFYMSQNEITVANEMLRSGKLYRVYRLYKIDQWKGEAHIKIYDPPFDFNHYAMEAVSWYIEKNK